MTTSDVPAAVPVARGLADKAYGFFTAVEVEAAIIGVGITLKLSARSTRGKASPSPASAGSAAPTRYSS